MASVASSGPIYVSPKRKREDVDYSFTQFTPQLNVPHADSLSPTSGPAGADSPRSAIARQLSDLKLREGASLQLFGGAPESLHAAKRSRPSYEVQRQPRVQHTAILRRRPSAQEVAQSRRRSSSAPPPSERFEGTRITSPAVANAHHRPLNPQPILSPPQSTSPQPTSSPSLRYYNINSGAKSSTTSPVPSPRGLMLPPTPTIATSTLRPTRRSPPPRPPPINVTTPLSSNPISPPTSSPTPSSSANGSIPNPQDRQPPPPHTTHLTLPTPFSPTSPLSPTALTWKPAEITGHLISHTLDTPDDDGYGINGIGFKPSPALALARQMRRRQQVQEWRAREAREMRAARWRKREGIEADMSVHAVGEQGGKVEGVSEVGGGGMKRVVRFA
ncbi:MAG: hypothetical protein M1820_010041 [Bogoriella megaspora]|nr:MAG: hypothetical protein M1820_010041 [Bogoriella megaspora]